MEEARAVAAIISRLPDAARIQASDELTWWCLANLDEHGDYIDPLGKVHRCNPRKPGRKRKQRS